MNFFLWGSYVFPDHLCHKGLWQQFNTLLSLNFLAKYFSPIYLSVTSLKNFFTIFDSTPTKMHHFTRTQKYPCSSTFLQIIHRVLLILRPHKCLPASGKNSSTCKYKEEYSCSWWFPKKPLAVLLIWFIFSIKPHKCSFLYCICIVFYEPMDNYECALSALYTSLQFLYAIFKSAFAFCTSKYSHSHSVIPTNISLNVLPLGINTLRSLFTVFWSLRALLC